MRRVVVALLLGATARAVADEPPLPEVAAALERIRGASTVELTTTGRRTGKPHTRPVWFVVDQGKIVVQAGKGGRTDWYRNVVATPAVTVRQGDYRFRARAVPVVDAGRVEEIRRLFLQKYTSAWLLSFLGSSIGRGQPVELLPQAVAVDRRKD